jgi:hypothetical protein
VEGASGTTGHLDDAAGFSYAGTESDDKEGAGPKPRAKHHEGKGTYTESRKKLEEL